MQGFAFQVCVGFRPFWLLALVWQALVAIFLAALRRFRGVVLFLGLHTSSRLGFPFWLLCLTVRCSGRLRRSLNSGVSLFTSQSSLPMLLHTAATCSSACALGRGRRSGLRLQARLGVQVFSGSSAYAPGASSSVLCSAVSNSALKRTRILRAAYLVR